LHLFDEHRPLLPLCEKEDDGHGFAAKAAPFHTKPCLRRVTQPAQAGFVCKGTASAVKTPQSGEVGSAGASPSPRRDLARPVVLRRTWVFGYGRIGAACCHSERSEEARSIATQRCFADAQHDKI